MKQTAMVLSAALLSALLLSAASVALAGPPVIGTYKTLSGTVLPGRASESMPCDGCEGQVGNLIMAESWSGSTLGTEWKLSCPQVAAAPSLLYDGVVNGTGQRIFQAVYGGGTLWLSGAGAWGSGDPFYSGTISSFTVIATKQYVNNQVVGVVANINFTGTIDAYASCFTLAISNAELVGATPDPPGQPGPFPAFQGPSDCNVTGAHGTYWDVHDVTFSILGRCEVPARSASWGQVKSFYR